MCGEKRKDRLDYYVPQGSPPRVRGKVNRSAKLLAADGITPACAGKRTRHAVKRHWSRDHPRVCGEKRKRHEPQQRTAGSPPRVRGKGTSAKDMPCAVGITPACAGKRGGRTVSFFLIRDHPRVCGEKARTLIAWEEPQGSPPRVRGKESNAKTGQKARRITPACAGKRATPSKNPHPGGDHPRVCGEKYTCAAVRACRLGSPPRVRGKD